MKSNKFMMLIVVFIILTAAVLWTQPAVAEPAPGTDFWFSSGLITGYRGPGGAVEIPSSIDGFPVTAIGNYVFRDNTSIESISIPAGVTQIGHFAFEGCSNLRSITIPNSVSWLGWSVFSNCTLLESITIPTGISFIPSGTFDGCSGLTSVILHDNVTGFDGASFRGCSSLPGITFPVGVSTIGEYAFAGCSLFESITIPAGVSVIGNGAFSGCGGLTSVTIPNGVTSLGSYAFAGCSGLTGIVLPSTLNSINAYAFNGCTGLTDITIPNGVTNIGGYAFQNCTSLTGITLPSFLASINDYTFKGCTLLSDVTIPNEVTYIGSHAFKDCIGLTSITIPNTVTGIGAYAFGSCSGLTNITIPDSVTSIGQYAFDNCSGATSITISSNLTSIERCAFYRCSSITGIIIPDKVTAIDVYAFDSCSSLTKARFMGNAPTVGFRAFGNSAAGFKVYYFREKTGFDTEGGLNGYSVFPLVSVTYGANDSAGGTVPVDGTLYEQGQPVTVLGNTGGLTHADADYVFIGWNTAADGSGTGYAPGNTFWVAGGGNINLYAQWRDVYTVTWKSQDGLEVYATNTVIAGFQPVFAGSAPEKNDTAQYDYNFVGWAATSGQETGTLVASLPAASGNITYYAAFSKTVKTYTVTWMSQDGNTALEADIAAPYGSAPCFDQADPTKDSIPQYDYNFVGWAEIPDQMDGTLEASLPLVLGNTTYFAAFSETERSYTVSFNSSGGSAVSSQSITYNHTAAEPAAPVKTGHTFDGWYTDSGFTAAYSFASAVTENITLYAKWTANDYTVTFDPEDGTVSLTSTTVTFASAYETLPTPTRTGYTFASWWTGDNGTGTEVLTTTTVNIAADHTLYARWTANTYTVTFDPESGTVFPASTTVTFASAYGTLPTPTRTGYAFAGWWTGDNGSGTEVHTTTTVNNTANHTLYAKWTVNTYTVTFDPEDGTVTLASKPVTFASVYNTLPTPTRTGFTFAGWWTGDNGSGTAVLDDTPVNIAANHALYAKWTIKTYTATWMSQDGSMTLEEDSAVPYGTAPSFNAAGPIKAEDAQYFYAFAGWADSSGQTAGNLEASLPAVTADIIYYATYSQTLRTYTVTWKSQDGLTILETDDDVPYGSAPSFDADDLTKEDTQQYYYVFDGWATGTGKNSGVAAGSLVVTSDITYYAAFGETLKTYRVTYIYNYDNLKEYTPKEYFSYGSTITAPISNPKRAGFAFSGWYKEPDCINAWDFGTDKILGRMALYAKWTANPPAAQTETHNADVKAGDGTEITLPVTVNKDTGTASIDISSQNLTLGGAVITLPSIPDINTYSAGILVSALSTPHKQGTLTLKTNNGSITVPSDMLTGIISGNKAEITIGQGDKDNLPDDIKSAIGDKPLISLTLSIDGKQTDWSNHDAAISVRIPYAPTAAELANPESIVIWYIDGAGNAVTIPNGRYDPITGTVIFQTTHFSDYAVAYHAVRFNDVTPEKWYNSAVSFIAARGIAGGTGGGNYSPDAKLTRGEFIVLMMRAYGIAPDNNPTDNFSDAGSTYYTGYLAAVKRLDISSGVGNNLFAPGKEITRQEMFTLLYNALEVLKQLPDGTSGKTLFDFSDAGDIALWAKDAMTMMARTGTVTGNGGKLSPTETTTRAEIAQVLYNLLSR